MITDDKSPRGGRKGKSTVTKIKCKTMYQPIKLVTSSIPAPACCVTAEALKSPLAAYQYEAAR